MDCSYILINKKRNRIKRYPESLSNRAPNQWRIGPPGNQDFPGRPLSSSLTFLFTNVIFIKEHSTDS